MDYNADGTSRTSTATPRTIPKRLNSSTLVAGTSYGYDDDSELTSLTYTDGEDDLVAGYHLDYNNAGLVTTAYSYADTSNTTDRTSTYTAWAKTQYNYDPTAKDSARPAAANRRSTPLPTPTPRGTASRRHKRRRDVHERSQR